MTLSNALFSSVTGLTTSSTAISVIGDNIANANTPGFKEKRAEFSAVLGQSITSGAGFSNVGAGAQTNNIGTLFSQGTFEDTARNSDLGIEGRGFFILESDRGRAYSRAGMFGFDAEGVLVDSLGNRVQGFSVDPATGQLATNVSDIQITSGLTPPQASSSIQFAMNLDADSAAQTVAFDPADTPGTTNTQQTITVYDSLGAPRSSTVFFRKVSPNSWEFVVTLADADALAATRTPGEPFVEQGRGTLDFDQDGNLIAMNGGTAPAPITFQFDDTAGSNPAQTITFSMGELGVNATGPVSTQYRTPNGTSFATQDGFASGSLSALEIDEDGRLNGIYSNGITTTAAQIALANFGNVEGLTDIGGSLLAESVGSGTPIVLGANSGGLGRIRSSALENSNVELAQQFVKLIVSQRAFQANTRTVSVANELLANLVALGQ